ncbi:unnamed protein product [Gadus morhua 'NCC']
MRSRKTTTPRCLFCPGPPSPAGRRPPSPAGRRPPLSPTGPPQGGEGGAVCVNSFNTAELKCLSLTWGTHKSPDRRRDVPSFIYSVDRCVGWKLISVMFL